MPADCLRMPANCLRMPAHCPGMLATQFSLTQTLPMHIRSKKQASNHHSASATLKVDTCDTNCTLKLASNHFHANPGSTASRVAMRKEKINLQPSRKNLNCCLMRVKIAVLRRPAQHEKIFVLRDPAAQPKKAVSMPIQ